MARSKRSGSAIRRKLTLSNWWVAVIPVVCMFAAVSVVFLHTMAENETRQAQADVSRACGEAERWISQAEEALGMLCLDINTQNAMGSYADAPLKAQLDFRDFFRNRLVGMYTSDMQMVSASLYLKAAERTFSQDYRDGDLARALGAEPWFQAMLAGKQGSYTGFGPSAAGGERVIRLARSIQSMRSGQVLGLGYVELSMARLARCFEPLRKERNTLVALGEELTLGTPPAGGIRYTLSGQVESLGLAVSCQVTSPGLAQAYALALFCFIGGLGVLMALIYGIDKRLADSFTRRILSQVAAAQRMGAGDFEIALADHEDDEIGEMSRSLERTAWAMKRLIEEKYLAEIQRQQASLHALQSQINPHFIYNTLERISMLALIHDQYEIVNIAQSFSAMMRYAIAPSGLVPLAAEIENLKHYISIQRGRFERPLSVAYELPPGEGPALPRLTLQPLVENAFRHGFDPQGEGAMRLTLRVRETQAGAEVAVGNNGRLISPQRIEEIQLLLETPLGQGGQDCFALRNICQRLKLIYGSQARLTIASQGNETWVRLWLPGKKEENHEPSGVDLR